MTNDFSNEIPVKPLVTPLRVILVLILGVLLIALILRSILDTTPGIPVHLRKPFPKLDVEGWFKETEPVEVEELEGKVRLIEAWAYWCGPCLQAAPHMRELYQRYHPLGVEFISVTNEDNEHYSEGVEFLKRAKIRWPAAYGADSLLSELAPDGLLIPYLWIVDKRGNIAWEGHPTAYRHGLIEALLRE